MNLESLSNWDPSVSDNLSYDLFLAFFNHEERSRDLATKIEAVCLKKIAIITKPIDKNEDGCAHDFGFSLVDVDSLKGCFSELAIPEDRKVCILIDISCMPRHVMAEVMSNLFSVLSSCNVRLRVNYTIASYSLPPADISANESIEAVHSDFSGWSYADSKPTSLILGLGYEPFKAEGASEFFEPYDQWVFVPESPVVEYLPMVIKNNDELLSRSSVESKTIYYKVDDPESTFGQLEQVVSLLAQTTNPVLMPFGPKILFFLCLIQSHCHPEVGVWCVTGNHPEEVGSSFASDYSCGIDCVFSLVDECTQ
ncbi:hypothetical protein PS870_01601 [Pseudomonas fluorescens]|uniref:Uncharacterized protein n=1 Tax=Pseudomonas fluorescens TaxID=294 RepID=A0A5E7IK88_PSEFL|nr:hypothetical protein [Pseudomonas fluorescens]VVO77141.1 hypothetical protein PS870_01601 [Pseudomonas fluorescens]